MMNPENFLEMLVKELVDNPSDVKVTRTVDEMGVLLTLDINPTDMGKIIGRSGRTAKAIRTLLRVVGMKHNARVNMKINEPEGSNRGANSESAMSEQPAPVAADEPEEDGAAIAAEMDAAIEDLKAGFE